MLQFKNIRLFSTFIIFIHVAIWLIIFQLHYDLLGLLESFIRLKNDKLYIDDAFVTIPTLVILFYLNSNFLIPKYLSRKLWWKYLLLIIFSFLILFYAGYIIVEYLFESGFEFEFSEPIEFYDHSLMLHLMVHLMVHWVLLRLWT